MSCAKSTPLQGFSSKNNRTRVDCVELLGDMLQEEGLAQCTRNKQKPFAAIAQVLLPFPHTAVLASDLYDASS